MAGTPLIELTNVAVDFDGKRRVSGITFSVNRGQFIYLTGPTGSGKSLVLKLIAGLLKPSAGEVRIGGDLVNNFTENQKMWMRRSMGIMLPDGVLLRDRSVIDNVTRCRSAAWRILRTSTPRNSPRGNARWRAWRALL